MNKYIIPLLLLILISCNNTKEKTIITKFVILENPSFSNYYYWTGYGSQEFRDSSNKYNVGDIIKK